MRFNLFLFVKLISFLYLPDICLAKEPLTLSDNLAEINLNPYLDVLEDKIGRLKLKDVLSPDYSKSFVHLQNEKNYQVFTESTFWYRFSVKNQGTSQIKVYLEQKRSLSDSVELFIPAKNTHERSGVSYPGSYRDLPYRNPLFILSLSPESVTTIYLKIKPNGTLAHPIYLMSEKRFNQSLINGQLVLGLVYGIILVIFLYSLITFFTTKDKSYLCFTLYLFTNILFLLIYDGLIFQYLSFSFGRWFSGNITIFSLISGIAGLQFLRVFLNLSERHKLLNKVILTLMFVSILFMLLSLFIAGGYSLLMLFYILGISLLGLFTAIYSYIQGYKPAGYYIAASSVFIIGIILNILIHLAILQDSFLGANPQHIGILLKLFLLSFALNTRVTALKNEKEIVYSQSLKTLRENLQSKEEFSASLEKGIEERTRELKESEERYRHLIDFSPSGIVVHRDSKIILVNRQALEIMKVPDESQVINLPLVQFVHPDYIETVRTRLEKISSKPGSMLDPQEQKYIRYDGEVIDVEVVSSSFMHENKLTFLTLFRDISTRKREQHELEKLYHAVENSPSTVIITDNKGTIEFANPVFTQITGYSIDEAIGNNPKLLKSGKMPLEIYEDLWKTISSGKKWHGELYNKKKNGDFYWENTSISPILDKEGNITHFIAVKEDITERKRLEKLKEDTERIIRHDLKNPLNGILGYSQLLLFEDNVSPSNQREWITSIYESGADMLDMLENSLDLFKMEEGSYQLNPKEFDLIKLIEKLDTELIILQEKKSLLTIYQLNDQFLAWDQSYPIVGEVNLLKSLFANLIKNAIEASPAERKITININDKNKDYHEITIHNWGVVPESIHETLFDRYVTSGKKDGTGLGTYSARLIARTHGGDINFSSSEEKGTELKVLLPRKITTNS